MNNFDVVDFLLSYPQFKPYVNLSNFLAGDSLAVTHADVARSHIDVVLSGQSQKNEYFHEKFQFWKKIVKNFYELKDPKILAKHSFCQG